MKELRFSVRFNSDMGSVKDVLRWIEMADEAGFYGAWYCEDLMCRDAWVVLSAAAVKTRRIKLGTAIVNPFTSDPAELAMRAASLQELSDGRFILGLGAGEPSFLRWVGKHQKKPLTGVIEAVERLRKLLAGERAPAEAGVLPAWSDEAYLRFGPHPTPVPIYVGGQGPRILEFMGRAADGALPIVFPPEYAPVVVDKISTGAQKVGRTLDDIDVSGCVWYCLSADRERAFDRLKPLVSYYGPRLGEATLEPIGLTPADFEEIGRLVDDGRREEAEEQVTDSMMRLAVVGNPDDVVPRLVSLVEQGVNHLNLGPPFGPDMEEAIRLTAEEVMPAVRREVERRGLL